MNNIPSPLQAYIEECIIPQYEHFDKAHQITHVRSVIEESMKLAYHYDVNRYMVYAIAAFHDLGLKENRERHHILSAEMIRTDERLKEWFNEEEIQIMAEAAEDHRASNNHAPRSIYGMIVAEADRNIEPYNILQRTVQYGLSHYPHLSKEEHYQRYYNHLLEKYAEGGYMKLWIPQSSNSQGLTALRNMISDKNKLRNLFDAIYENEK